VISQSHPENIIKVPKEFVELLMIVSHRGTLLNYLSQYIYNC